METGFKKRSYVFPETGDHTIEWIGRRYMLLKADGNYKMEIYQGALQQELAMEWQLMKLTHLE